MKFLRTKYSIYSKIILLLIIKYSYMFLTIELLDGLWYPGIGSYEINFIIEKEIIGTILFVITIIFVDKKRSSSYFKSSIIDILFLLYYMPMNSSFALQNFEFIYILLTTIYFNLIVYFVSLKKENNIKTKKMNYKNEFAIEMVCVIFCLLYIVYKISYNGLYFNFSLSADLIYGIRSEYTDYLVEIDSTFMSYILLIIKNITSVAVFYLLYKALSKKNILLILLSIFTILCIFSVNSSKSIIFFTIITFGIYILDNRNLLKYFNNILTMGILFLLILCLIECLIFKNSYMYTYVIRRELFYPSWLNHMYYDFFSANDKLLWSDSVFLFQKFMPKSYNQSVLNLISNTYFDGISDSPNTGLFAEAFMHFGIFGIVIYPLIISIMFNFVSLALRGENKGIILVLGSKMCISMTNVPILRTDFIFSIVAFCFVILILKVISFESCDVVYERRLSLDG